jgi:hypothetical protein
VCQVVRRAIHLLEVVADLAVKADSLEGAGLGNG